MTQTIRYWNPLFSSDPANRYLYQPFSVNLLSTRASIQASGTMQVKLGFVDAANPQSLMDFKDVYAELVRRSRPSLVSAPPVRFFFFFGTQSCRFLSFFAIKRSLNRLKVLALFALINTVQSSKMTGVSVQTNAMAIRKTKMKNLVYPPFLNSMSIPWPVVHNLSGKSCNQNPSDPKSIRHSLRSPRLPVQLQRLPLWLNLDLQVSISLGYCVGLHPQGHHQRIVPLLPLCPSLHHPCSIGQLVVDLLWLERRTSLDDPGHIKRRPITISQQRMISRGLWC